VSEVTISLVKCATDTETRDVTLHGVLIAIRTGGKLLRGQVEKIRSEFKAQVAKNGGDLQKAKLAVDPLKKALPAVTLSGKFSYRANDKLEQYSGLFCADADLLGTELEKIRDKLKQSPFVYALFRSPTGIGLKTVFRVAPDPLKHPGSYRAVEKHVRELTGIQIDQKCKDVARLCFMSYDPEIYINENARELEPLPEPKKPKPVQSSDGALPPDMPLRERIATKELGLLKWSVEKGGHFCTCPGEHLHTTTTGEKHTMVYLDKVPTLDCQHESCAKIVAAFNAKLRSEIGKAERQAKREAPRAKGEGASDEDSTELTSLTSLGDAEYPAPPDEAAYYGLAGDIVRRIAPQTEADRVALLFQLLAAFGNIIGRNAYMLADGARHYLKLFIVLVGKTSKGRKGTAWRHVFNLMRHVDEEWCKNIGHGLSSGEGLIWAVRDKIEGKKFIREKGKPPEYKTVVIDDGVSDKRLLVIESEFASVLKQGPREGNILSAVIRSAWEDDNLRIMTKNTPARATDAHISIIGHITREEYRRELTQTESANGFANRYCIVAVDRSKCLPEGGQAVEIADLVVRLQKAIEFAKNRGELKRDDAARKLWAQVYPALSEGKRGLLGAITGRAEAQVLRFSGLYALLDCSDVVKVEHLKAALALWGYSERSAAWVFETGTGDKNADKILAALRVAAEKGLPKWKITANVFSRNATKHDIDEALRLLHHLKLATCKVEETGGRSLERWFYKAKGHEKYEESSQTDRPTADISFTSYGQPSENTSSAESDTGSGEPKTEQVSGDMKL
jgi:hypothetical protein